MLSVAIVSRAESCSAAVLCLHGSGDGVSTCPLRVAMVDIEFIGEVAQKHE